MMQDTSRYSTGQMVDVDVDNYPNLYNSIKKDIENLLRKHNLKDKKLLQRSLLDDARDTIPSFADEDNYNRSNYLLKLVTSLSYTLNRPSKLVSDDFQFKIGTNRSVFVRIIISDDISMNDEAYLNEHMLRFKLDCFNAL